MKAVQLNAYNRNVLRALLSLEVTEKEVAALKDDEVLIKLHAASCNPSDIAFIQGGYNIVKTLPTIPGFEGSGMVVETGTNAKDLIGKRVSCFIQENVDGTWAEFLIARKENLIILDEKLNLDQAACFSVNPFTAYALIEIATKRESEAIIQNAAGGQVPSLVRQIAKLKGINTINIVRKSETAEMLKSAGEKYVLFEQDGDFVEKLKQLANDLKATTAFDAVGGQSSGSILNAMPSDSELVIYGGLSNKAVTDINPMDVIFKNKIISGFNLLDWKKDLPDSEFSRINNELQQLIIDGKLKTTIQGEIEIADIIKGLKTYLGNMSMGKILIKS